MPFDPNKDKIAITIPKFTLRKKSDGHFDKYSEPYITSLAIDASGSANPKIDFNIMSFPKIAAGGTVTMLGDGHIIYGPKNPGDFVAVSVLMMESDKDMQKLGSNIAEVVKSKAVDLGIKALVVANPGHAAVLAILKEVTLFVSSFLKKNEDDFLFRTEGTFLKGHPVPYHINRSYQLSNDYIRLDMKVIPLSEHNGEGPAPKALAL